MNRIASLSVVFYQCLLVAFHNSATEMEYFLKESKGRTVLFSCNRGINRMFILLKGHTALVKTAVHVKTPV